MGESFSRRPPELPIFQFCKKTNSWVSIKRSKKEPGNVVSQITVVTYNVCFESDFFDQRCEQIFQLLQCQKVDIVCLQEVVPNFLEKLKKEPWVQDYYYLSNDRIDPTLSLYGSILLTTIPPKALRRWQLPSTMGRDCLEAEFIINNQTFSFATIHLESLDYPQKRKEQLISVSHILLSFPSAVILGDFNFDSSQDYSHLETKRDMIRRGMPIDQVESMLLSGELKENDILKSHPNLSEYSDVWSESGLVPPTEKGYTYDSEKNKMIRGYERVRYDRILLRSKYWEPKAISLIGDQAVPPCKVGGAVVFPSDHFGLIMTLEIKNQNNQNSQI